MANDQAKNPLMRIVNFLLAYLSPKLTNTCTEPTETSCGVLFENSFFSANLTLPEVHKAVPNSPHITCGEISTATSYNNFNDHRHNEFAAVMFLDYIMESKIAIVFSSMMEESRILDDQLKEVAVLLNVFEKNDKISSKLKKCINDLLEMADPCDKYFYQPY